MALLDYFPYEDGKFEPSKEQTHLIQSIDDAFKSGYKFVICCAPTGSGKSFLSKTLANFSKESSDKFRNLIESYNAFRADQYGDYFRADECRDEPPFGAFALTITKGLQDQYTNSFDDAFSLKGKSSYICRVDPSCDVEVAPCLFNAKLKEGCILNCRCDYYNNRKDTLINKFGILNYSMFLSLPDHVKRREYIVCDEASELEDELVKRFSRSLNYKILKRLGFRPQDVPVENYKKFRIWLESLKINLGNEVEELKKILNKKKKSTFVDSDVQRYKLFSNLHSQIKVTLDTWEECEYVIEHNLEGVTLKPLRVERLSDSIFRFGDKVLLMSATIIDHANFAKTLGIKKYKYIEVDSAFEPKNAPIYVKVGEKINFKNLKEKLPKLCENTLKICELHKHQKGIIHTHTMEITQYLKDRTNDPRFLFRIDGQNNESIIKQHLESKEPTILVSPSMAFGVDLKEDLARFQILMKAAYMPLNDERIKRLFKEDPEWYVNKMLNNLIQACGRGVRTKNDKCITYILDGTITDAVIRSARKLPRYFLARFV
jgi:ATP-dependent DNA helicase DinG